MINQKTAKMIRKYAKLRGKNQIEINEKTLRLAWDHASPQKQAFYKKEMQEYFRAVDEGRIKPGESILLSALATNQKEDTTAEDERDTKTSL